MHDIDARVVAVSEAVYTAEALDHAVECGKVADHVVGNIATSEMLSARSAVNRL